MLTGQDVFLVLFLAFLETVLSIDNALVLAMIARHLPRDQQRKALTYGLVGAIVFRLISLFLVTYLIRWTWVKIAGGGYLVAIAAKHFLKGSSADGMQEPKRAGFWKTVLLIEVMDIAFAVDSILAAVALTSKFWVIFVGGMLGVISMRFAATVFIRVLERFPNFETSAYLMVLLIGLKVLVDVARLPGIDFHSAQSPAFWIFWGLMLACIALGFRRRPAKSPSS